LATFVIANSVLTDGPWSGSDLSSTVKVHESDLQGIKVAVTSSSILVVVLLLIVLAGLLTPVWMTLYRRHVSQTPNWLKRIGSIVRTINSFVFVTSFILILATVIYLPATTK
jgi:hypothetical protein